MKNDFKRSFVGYNAKDVSETIKALELEHERNLNALKNRLASLENENNILKTKITGLQEELVHIKNTEKEIIESLVNSHVKKTQSIDND